MAAIAGDPADINQLFLSVRPVIVRYCRARMSGATRIADADDVVQEVCVGLLAALPTYDGGAYRFLSFVYGIAGHKVVDHFRKCRRDRTDPCLDTVPEIADPAPGPEAVAAVRADSAYLSEMMRHLTDRQRAVLAWRIVAGMTSAETAEATGMSPVAVRVTQRRALIRLRAVAGHRVV